MKAKPNLVMQVFEELECAVVILNHPSGAKTVYLSKADATKMMMFIGQQSTPIKPIEQLMYERGS